MEDPYHRHALPLEGGREARLVIPRDLTTEDAERIVGIVEAIAWPAEIPA